MPRNVNKKVIKHNAHHSNIIRWKESFAKNEDKYSKNPKKNKIFTAGRKATYDEILTDLKELYVHHSRNRLTVSMNLLFTKFKQLYIERNG